jgi:hypothetical protein
MKSFIIRLGIGLVVAAFLCTPFVEASSQPTFKVQIVAPECTIDTINDGSGPIQIITCPPGTIDPEPNPTPGEDTPISDSGNGIDTTPASQVSQRIYSPNDTFSLLEILQDPDLSLDVLERIAQQPSATIENDIIPAPKDTEPNIIESFVVPSVIVTVAVVSGSYLIAGPRIIQSISHIFRRR